MNAAVTRRARRQQGMVLIISLLLLLVVTILALAMFRGVGLEGRIAGNVMDKQRALQAAASTEDYAEQWLVSNAALAPLTVCSAATFQGATSPTVCSNSLVSSTDAASVTTVPWDMGGNNNTLGYGYNPATSSTTTLFPVNAAGGQDNYYQAPTVYITYLGPDHATANGVDYQVDAWSYGGSTGTVAVVESIYQIRYIATGGGGP
jgi:type IV pilus assembly protein PilX